MPRITRATTAEQLRPGPGIRALLFDFDGTLFHNHGFNFRALRQGLAFAGVPITEAWFHENAGHAAREMVLAAAREAGLQVDPDAVLRARDDWAQERLAEVAVIEPVMNHLREPGGRAVGVVTGSQRSNIAGLLALHDLEARLDVLVTRDDLDAGKPSPEGYLLALRRLGITAPSEALVYEDSDEGVAAARAAGTHVVDVRSLRRDDGSVA